MKLLLLALFLFRPAAAGPSQEPGRPERPADDAPANAQAGADEPALGDIPIEELSGEERAAAEAALHARLEEEYFHATDQDGGGWISFREGAAQLRMDRPEFFRFDADADGRITRDEFGARYGVVVAATRSFRPPASHKALFATPEDTPMSFDANRSGALEESELRTLLADRDIDVPANALFALLDADGSGALESREVEGILQTLAPFASDAPTLFGGRASAAASVRPRTVRDLFGRRVPREGTFGGPMPSADRIEGPIAPFDRLDYDGDGRITEQDLVELLRPARVDVRATAVIAALDRDGDGRLSPAELARGFGD